MRTPVEISDPNFRWNELHLYLTVWCANHRGYIKAASYLLDFPIEHPPGGNSEAA